MSFQVKTEKNIQDFKKFININEMDIVNDLKIKFNVKM